MIKFIKAAISHVKKQIWNLLQSIDSLATWFIETTDATRIESFNDLSQAADGTFRVICELLDLIIMFPVKLVNKLFLTSLGILLTVVSALKTALVDIPIIIVCLPLAVIFTGLGNALKPIKNFIQRTEKRLQTPVEAYQAYKDAFAVEPIVEADEWDDFIPSPDFSTPEFIPAPSVANS